MSYTKLTFKNQILIPVNRIQENTVTDIDFTLILEYLNIFMEIREDILIKDPDIGQLWNEIIFDLLSSIHSASSGFYRSATTTLRSILEIGCYSIFYYDHKIEFSFFQNENAKADKYVSTLINNYDFFKTKYIRSFYPSISNKEKCEDSVSQYLNGVYAKLSDVVHGRYGSLLKIKDLEINYNKENFKRYERLLFETLSILAVLYLLRFSNQDINKYSNLTKISGVLNV